MGKRVDLVCQSCGAVAKRLGMRDTDGKFVCAECTPDSTWKMYPGSKKRATMRAQKAALAKRNFGK